MKNFNNRYFCKNIHRYFTDISDISDISVKSIYRYIRVYRYFDPWAYIYTHHAFGLSLSRIVAHISNGADGGHPDRANEADPGPSALQVIPHSDRAEGQPSRSKFMRSGLPRPTLLDRIITDCYASPRGSEPPRVEVSALGVDEVKHIMRRWEPLHHGESAAYWLNNLYSHMLRMPVVARGMGLGEDYTVSVPAGTRKEDLQRNINDGIQVRNRNYVQSIELVR